MFGRKKRKNESEHHCFICQSPLEMPFKAIVMRDEKGDGFEVDVHYFPPCYNLDYIISKFPNCSYSGLVAESFSLKDVRKYEGELWKSSKDKS